LQIKGRTLAALLAITVVISSMATYMLVQPVNGVATGVVHSLFEQLGMKSPDRQTGAKGTKAADLNKINEVYQLIKQNYVQKVDDQKLVDGAINGMMGALDDPYSVYMDPKSSEQFNDSINSSFQGIGAEVSMEGGKVTIVSPFKGSPAEKAGLRPKDQILSVNGTSLDGLDLYQAVAKIRGPKGTKAQLEIQRPGVQDKITLSVTRDEIPIETVYSDTIHKDGLTFGKIEVSQFSTNTATRFKEELTKLEKENVNGLAIDLRGDPGGLLNVVVEMGQMLVPNKGVILQVEDPTGKREVVKSTLADKKPYPIVVLIDKGSASASEIFAGAMKENGYSLIGTTSFGKGTVQNTVELGDKSQVKMTIAKWLTPSGSWIHKKGINPNVKIEQPKYFSAAPIDLGKGSLKFDQNSDQVKNLQLILDGLGFAPGRQDGYFDDKTQLAVKSFQKINGLTVTGEVDKKTAELMQESLIKKMKNPANDMQLQAALQVLENQAKK
jgi:carboxyl-terminal processing protease